MDGGEASDGRNESRYPEARSESPVTGRASTNRERLDGMDDGRVGDSWVVWRRLGSIGGKLDYYR